MRFLCLLEQKSTRLWFKRGESLMNALVISTKNLLNRRKEYPRLISQTSCADSRDSTPSWSLMKWKILANLIFIWGWKSCEQTNLLNLTMNWLVSLIECSGKDQVPKQVFRRKDLKRFFRRKDLIDFLLHQSKSKKRLFGVGGNVNQATAAVN